jgi:CheY-like chemotaxis protein
MPAVPPVPASPARARLAPHAVPLTVPPGPSFLTEPAPLHGLTVLAVEDSRFASEALRLICQRSGARLRRAETLALATVHLAVYRPDVVIVDLGLPDGRGEGLIRSLAALRPRPGVLLGTSGEPLGREAAMAAGADGFLDKPVRRVDDLLGVILHHLPDRSPGVAGPAVQMPRPDALALHDDLRWAADFAAARPDGAGRRYLAGFVRGVARLAGDGDLEAAAGAAAAGSEDGLGQLERTLHARLAANEGAFSRA